jgi:hypothetical protein
MNTLCHGFKPENQRGHLLFVVVRLLVLDLRIFDFEDDDENDSAVVLLHR